ncbi:hypothetical protein ADICYQ_1540 [Cyclobacterium qasimii M12-11B]|uniref:Uncharacterized protein n=1 Tax=Cyclobacterium qasimii M12-11B TaxID=641524 RepID=S7WZT9_9BACT|nr:hypothetical protein ADICYQ_1540 [Cyclobacterium qasimii M12-11B]
MLLISSDYLHRLKIQRSNLNQKLNNQFFTFRGYHSGLLLPYFSKSY